MATKAEVKNFIGEIAPIAQELCRKREKWILPSVTIAQAACESNWGTSKAMAAANGLFGFKVGAGKRYGTAWKGASYNTKTKEYYGTYVTIRDNFRAYDTVADSVEDYMDLLCSLSRYSGAVNQKDAKTCIIAIKNGGYATSPTYISTIMSIINSHDLTQYDSIIAGGTAQRPVLRNGSRGEYVRELQQLLSAAGFACKIDGVFGAETRSAVRTYQAVAGLSVDGIVGPKTWAELK